VAPIECASANTGGRQSGNTSHEGRKVDVVIGEAALPLRAVAQQALQAALPRQSSMATAKPRAPQITTVSKYFR
jgi:hypothetical protein